MENKQQISRNDVKVDPDFCNAILGVLKNAVVKMKADSMGDPEKAMAADMMDDCLALAEEGAEWMTFDAFTRDEASTKLAEQITLYCFVNGLDKNDAAEMAKRIAEKVTEATLI